MTDAKFFHLGQFFSLRALLTTVIGVGLIAVTEFVLPYFEILNFPELQQWFTPTIVFTLAVIMVASAVAKNIVSSIFLAIAAVLSFYNPYETAADYGNLFNTGYVTVVIIYLLVSLLTGLFATIEMTGRTALLWIGIIYGLQGLIGAGASMFLSFGYSAHDSFHDAGFGAAFGETINGIPVYDMVVGIFSIIYMLVFIIISRKRVSTTVTSNKHEIIGQIMLFLSIVAGLVFMIFAGRTKYTQTDAAVIFGDTSYNVEFMNMIFQKVPYGDFTIIRYLNVFYVLPIIGFAMGIAMAIMVYKRAQGTTDKMRFNFEGAFLWLNLAPLVVSILLSSFVIRGLFAGATFWLEMPTMIAVFTEYTSLLLVNLLVAYIIFRIIALFKAISKK